MSYSVPVNLVVVISFVIFVFYVLGIHNILTKRGENDCDMTYMFEFPQFVVCLSLIHLRFLLFYNRIVRKGNNK